MADSSGKTEKPTQRRLQKARKEGQFSSSKDFVGGMQFTVAVAIFATFGSSWLTTIRHSTRAIVEQAFRPDLDSAILTQLIANTFRETLLPLVMTGATLVATGLLFQFATTQMGLSLSKVAPSLKHFQPFSKIKQIPSQALPSAVQAILMLVLSATVLYWLAAREAQALFLLPLSSVEVGLTKMRTLCFQVLWKGAALLLVFGFVDLFRQKRRFMKQMRMSKQEVRDELKETEGNPQIKARVRRLQREFRRRKMITEVATATAVIVNPTHFAVAIRYRHDSMVAPVVVAKGKDFLALRIRAEATKHEIPLIENPPLAQALYKNVKVGQEIPAAFYKAIAEILAYVYRVMGTQV